MFAFYIAGAVVIVIGAVMLRFPEIVNSLNRFSNELEGVETRQGETYELGQKIRALIFIVMGIFLLLLPGIIQSQ